MKNILFKTSISIIIVLSLMISMFSFVTFAAPGDTILSFSSSSVTVGSSVSVTVKVSGIAISGAQLNVAYDSNILSYVSGATSGGAGIVQLVKEVDPTTSASFTINFATLKSGSATISVSGVIADGQFPNVTDVQIKGASAVLQVKDAALSSNANLKALSVSAGYLSPKFSANRTNYTVNVKNSVQKCDIYATAADSDANVVVSPANGTPLNVGKNTRTITVTAPSGDIKKYTINIIRSETDEEANAPEETPEVNPLEIAEGEFEKYTIIPDLSETTLFKGFSAVAATYNQAEISVATDEKGEYKLYYLKAPEGEGSVICTYDEANKTFKQLTYVTQGDYTYILADLPDGLAMPQEYYVTNTKIGETDIKCYGNAATPDFFYIYCYADSKYGFYRFDSRENVLQRYPELEPIKDIIEEPAVNKGILGRFNSLSTNSKIILGGFIFVVLAVIALIVLLIIKLVKNKKNFDDSDIDNADDFDDISINGNFFITDSEPQEDDSEE